MCYADIFMSNGPISRRIPLFLCLKKFFSKRGHLAGSGERGRCPISGKGENHPSPTKGGEKMGSIPREYEQRCQFDAFCKSVLRNEAWNLKRSMKRQRRRVTPLDTVPQTEWDKLSTTDCYPSDSFVFSSHG